MNQFSVQITDLNHALLVQKALFPNIGAWHVAYNPDMDYYDYYKMVFKSKYDLDTIERILGNVEKIDITFLKQDY